MKSIISLLLLLSFSNFNLQTKRLPPARKIVNPFDTLQFDKVMAYDYDGAGERPIVSDNNLLMPITKIRKQVEVSILQHKKLQSVLGNTVSYGGAIASCFDPHIGIVYYRKNRIVAHISICLACNYHQSKPAIPAQESHKSTACENCFDRGYSKIARKQLSAFVKELNFSHWQLNSGLFDK